MCTLNANKGSAAADPILGYFFAGAEPIFGHLAATEQEAKKAGKQLSAWLTDGKIVDFNGTGIR